MIVYERYNLIYWKRIGNVLGDFGANRVHFGSKIGTPEIAYKYNCIIRIFRIKAYFTVVNVPDTV